MSLNVRSIFGVYSGFSQQVWLFTVGTMIIFGGQMLTRSAALYLSIATDIGVTEIGGIVSIASIGGIAGAVLAPIITAKFGNAKTCLYTQSISCIVPFTILFMNSAIIIGISLSIISFCRAIFRPAYNASVLDAAGEQNRTRAYSLYITVTNIGSGISALMAGALLSVNSIYVPSTESVFGLIGTIVIFLAFRGRIHKVGQKSILYNPRKVKLTMLSICICAVYLLSEVVTYQTFVTVPIFLLGSYQLSPFQVGALNLIMTWPIAILSLPVTHYIRRFDQFYVASLAMFLLGVSFLILLFGSDFFTALGSRIVYLCASILLYPALIFLLLFDSPEDGKSQYLSRYYLMSAFAGLVAPIGGSAIMSHLSSEILWICCFVISLVSVAVIFGSSLTVENRGAARPEVSEASSN